MTMRHQGTARADMPCTDAAALIARYRAIRDLTEQLAAPLSAEDQTIQSMPDASPAKWHRAHTTWFFETFLLLPNLPGYEAYDPAFGYLFNSYYEQVGPRHPRPQRGLITRPGIEAVARYRAHVDAAMERLLDGGAGRDVIDLVELGLNHEQQHQELLLTDIKHALHCNPLRPAYAAAVHASGTAPPLRWIEQVGGIVEIGHAGAGFAFDNEGPRHRVWLQPFRLASRLVTNGEYQAFMADGGYRRAELWLSEGWATVQAQGWDAPMYWQPRDGGEGHDAFTLHGLRALDPDEPVAHVSCYEADAYARWAGKRLPTEPEWEWAARDQPVAGNLLETGRLHPGAATDGDGLRQMYGDVWEWTGSAYSPYPGFRSAPGAVGEYNGKFMISQMVLRGGSCATPPGHVRITYRNFFPPPARWQFSGIRLAEDA